MRRLAFALAILLPALAPAAEPTRHRQVLDVAAGAGNSRYSTALSWSHTYAWLPRLRAGLGARLASFAGAGHHRYTSAPAALVDAGRVEDLRVHAPLTTSLNVQVVGTVRLYRGLEAGFDLDLAGFALGPTRSAISASPDPRFAGYQRADVARWNAFLVGARDRGQLDSEFFLAWWASDRLVVRAGVSHFVTEYRTEHPLDDGNRRFRLSRNLGFVALGWRLD